MHHVAALVGFCIARATPLPAAILTGTVIGDGGHPVAGATVQVVQPAAEPPCESTTAADGTFRLSCGAAGRRVVRASFGELQPWEIADVELGPGHEVHLNFLLRSAVPQATAGSLPESGEAPPGLWSRPLPNPLLASAGGWGITLRLLAIGVAGGCFVLGALTMLAIGRRFGIVRRSLSPGEVGDMLLNPQTPAVGERVNPLAVAGARGAAATVSYGGDEIAAALRERRYALVFASLVVAPMLFALSASALALAMLIGQEAYLLAAASAVPAGFVATAIVIGIQGWARSRVPAPGKAEQRRG